MVAEEAVPQVGLGDALPPQKHRPGATEDVRLDVLDDACIPELTPTELAHGFVLEGSPYSHLLAPTRPDGVFALVDECDDKPLYKCTAPGSDVLAPRDGRVGLRLNFGYSRLTEQKKNAGAGMGFRKSDGGRVPVGTEPQTWSYLIGPGKWEDRQVTVRGLASAEERSAVERELEAPAAAAEAVQQAAARLPAADADKRTRVHRYGTPTGRRPGRGGRHRPQDQCPDRDRHRARRPVPHRRGRKPLEDGTQKLSACVGLASGALVHLTMKDEEQGRARREQREVERAAWQAELRGGSVVKHRGRVGVIIWTDIVPGHLSMSGVRWEDGSRSHIPLPNDLRRLSAEEPAKAAAWVAV